MTEPSKVDWFRRRIWLWGFILFVGYEVFTLGGESGDTLSETVRDTLRFSPWRLLLLPFWAWLTWHWILLPPNWSLTPTTRDVIIIGLALVWAVIEIVVRYGVSPK